ENLQAALRVTRQAWIEPIENEQMSLRAQARHEAADDRLILAARNLIRPRKFDDQQQRGENDEGRSDPGSRDDVSAEHPAKVDQPEIDENREGDCAAHE